MNSLSTCCLGSGARGKGSPGLQRARNMLQSPRLGTEELLSPAALISIRFLPKATPLRGVSGPVVAVGWHTCRGRLLYCISPALLNPSGLYKH